MNIVYCFNDNKSLHNKEQISLLGISLTSLLRNHSNNNILIYIIIYRIHPENLEFIKNIVKEYKTEITFIFFPERLERNLSFMMSKSIPANPGTFLRLFLGELLPTSVENLLYLDTDTIIHRNFYEDYINTNISGYSIAGVLDPYIPFSRKKERDLGLQKKSYINAGVLIVNLKKIRGSLMSDVIEVFKKYEYIFADQDALNIAYNSSTLYISDKFNSIVNEKYDENAFIHHYASRGKLFYISPAIIHKNYQKKFWKYVNKLSIPIKKPHINQKDLLIYIVYKIIPKKIISIINKLVIYR